jgi:uncharacterized protein
MGGIHYTPPAHDIFNTDQSDHTNKPTTQGTSMNRIAAALLLAFSLPLAAHADEASHRAKAQELITLLHTQQLFEHNADSLKTQLSAVAGNTIGPDPTLAKKAEADDFIKQASQLIDAKLSWSAMQPGVTDIYVKNFTEEQLDAIVAFYKTPAGSAFLTNMSAVSTQVTALGTQRLSVELRPQLMQLVTTFKQKEAPAAPATPPIPAAPHTPAPAK